MGEQTVDQLLDERVQRGDKKAFDILVAKYQHKSVKLISRYVHDLAEVWYVAQDAFIKAYRALPKIRGESAFYTWLYRIDVYTAMNYLVAQGRRPLDIAVDIQDAEQYESATELRDKATPERMLLKDEIEKTEFEVIDALPEDLRTAIT